MPTDSLLPPDESNRLRSLRAHQVLSALSEPIFDEFVALTAQVFSLPISLISVVEQDEVFYPAAHGMPGQEQQPRPATLCSTAVEQGRVVVYHDGLLEPGAALPLAARQAAQATHVRFYAGAVLRLPDQQPLGTLCIVDRRPRSFSEPEQQVLELLATLISQTIAVRYRCLGPGSTVQTPWEQLHPHLQEELRALTALVRYLYARYGFQVPVSAEVLTQIKRRLRDLQTLLVLYRDGEAEGDRASG